jgi:NADPH-dependent 2,4-dienoyl-CoA reductase/sulfur reductase-like enzyme
MKRLHFDVLIVGAGPAGLAAAEGAAQAGASVAIADDNPAPGGQIWRGGHADHAEASRLLARRAGVRMLNRSRVIAPLDAHTLLAETPDDTRAIGFDQLILATGARELFLPFPGWTLPGVMGAGGLQALVKGGLPIRGKRVVVAGSGPLLLAVAAHLLDQGAQVVRVAEQAPLWKMVPFGLSLARHRDKLGQSTGLAWALRRTRYQPSSWVVAAHGQEWLESVTLQHGDRTETIGCEYLACGYGLVPNIELPGALGCAVRDGVVRVGRWQQSSVPDVYCAGEVAGIGGLDLSLVEGKIAGFAATGQRAQARRLFAERAQARRFAALLGRTFAPRPELRGLPLENTIVCRCEDVPYGALAAQRSWRGAKLQTRCGMGPCQGRVCGGATQFLFGWTQDSVRPPLAAARVASLALAEQAPLSGGEEVAG